MRRASVGLWSGVELCFEDKACCQSESAPKAVQRHRRPAGAAGHLNQVVGHELAAGQVKGMTMTPSGVSVRL